MGDLQTGIKQFLILVLQYRFSVKVTGYDFFHAREEGQKGPG